MHLRILDKKHNAHAFFQLGYAGGEKLFSVPSVLECVVFEVYDKSVNFSFDEDKDNYKVEFVE